jgi:hypothetical protein
MRSRAEDFARLSLIVERLQDAELLLAEEGETLSQQIEAVHRSLDAGDTVAAGLHRAQFVQTVETLVRSNRLASADANRLLEMLEIAQPFALPHQAKDGPSSSGLLSSTPTSPEA